MITVNPYKITKHKVVSGWEEKIGQDFVFVATCIETLDREWSKDDRERLLQFPKVIGLNVQDVSSCCTEIFTNSLDAIRLKEVYSDIVCLNDLPTNVVFVVEPEQRQDLGILQEETDSH